MRRELRVGTYDTETGGWKKAKDADVPRVHLFLPLSLLPHLGPKN